MNLIAEGLEHCRKRRSLRLFWYVSSGEAFWKPKSSDQIRTVIMDVGPSSNPIDLGVINPDKCVRLRPNKHRAQYVLKWYPRLYTCNRFYITIAATFIGHTRRHALFHEIRRTRATPLCWTFGQSARPC